MSEAEGAIWFVWGVVGVVAVVLFLLAWFGKDR
jgi:hypothetical protein